MAGFAGRVNLPLHPLAGGASLPPSPDLGLGAPRQNQPGNDHQPTNFPTFDQLHHRLGWIQLCPK
jgi:hypothetical protein